MLYAKAGYYHSRETFGTVDGQGIRYVLFLAGCQLGCKFCHNPDTWQQGSQTITVEEVLADLAKYRVFYEQSGGGITVSGGEPLLQPNFVSALFQACREQGIHTTLDTAGYYPTENLISVLPYTDAVLFSIKAIDQRVHRELTEQDNAIILANLKLATAHVPVTVRYVVIPGITDNRQEVVRLAELIQSLSVPVTVELLPYHTFGRAKWDKMGWPYQLGEIAAAGRIEVQKVQQCLEELGLTVLTSDL